MPVDHKTHNFCRMQEDVYLSSSNVISLSPHSVATKLIINDLERYSKHLKLSLQMS